jgi:hypothetical protein
MICHSPQHARVPACASLTMLAALPAAAAAATAVTGPACRMCAASGGRPGGSRLVLPGWRVCRLLISTRMPSPTVSWQIGCVRPMMRGLWNRLLT